MSRCATASTVAMSLEFDARKAGMTQTTFQYIATASGNRMCKYVWFDASDESRYATATIGTSYDVDGRVFTASLCDGSGSDPIVFRRDKRDSLGSALRKRRIATARQR